MKKYLISFFIGLFVIGVGFGVIFGEIASFDYAGDKYYGGISEEKVNTFTFDIDSTSSSIKVIDNNVTHNFKTNIIQDVNMPKNEIKFSIAHDSENFYSHVSKYNNHGEENFHIYMNIQNIFPMEIVKYIFNDLKDRKVYLYKAKTGDNNILDIYINPANANRIDFAEGY